MATCWSATGPIGCWSWKVNGCPRRSWRSSWWAARSISSLDMFRASRSSCETISGSQYSPKPCSIKTWREKLSLRAGCCQLYRKKGKFYHTTLSILFCNSGWQQKWIKTNIKLWKLNFIWQQECLQRSFQANMQLRNLNSILYLKSWQQK